MFSLRNRIGVICVAISMLLSIEAIFSNSFNIEEQLIFRLYTPANPIDYQKLKILGSPSISSTSFDPRIPTRIFIHGFKSKEKTIDRYREAFFKIGNFNFIGVCLIRFIFKIYRKKQFPLYFKKIDVETLILGRLDFRRKYIQLFVLNGTRSIG